MHEFLYPLMQGYDSVAMDVDGEVGGNDQTFNMLVGRDLMKKLKGKEKFVITMKLLADPSGKKMGKTEGNMVSFLDTPADCFGKVMSWPDTAIIPAAESCTLLPEREIAAMKEALESGANPKEEKMKLAEAVTTLLHGVDEAAKAKSSFHATFAEGKPEEFLEISVSTDKTHSSVEEESLNQSGFAGLSEKGGSNVDTAKRGRLSQNRRRQISHRQHRFIEISNP